MNVLCSLQLNVRLCVIALTAVVIPVAEMLFATRNVNIKFYRYVLCLYFCKIHLFNMVQGYDIYIYIYIYINLTKPFPVEKSLAFHVKSRGLPAWAKTFKLTLFFNKWVMFQPEKQPA